MLETFEDNKSPGEDEFTAEFYKHFFDLVGTDLINSLNQAFEVGEFSISQRRGIITQRGFRFIRPTELETYMYNFTQHRLQDRI